MSEHTPNAHHRMRIEPSIWTLRLWGLPNPHLDLSATLVVVAVLAASRFLLLASGPWEWDETLFARGVLRFDLTAHFPHPPGFPLWLALGWYVLPLVREPLHGLQLLSAMASCLTLWPLAALGRRVAPPAVAAAAALLMLFAPGVWLHAVRGFSSTPAAFLALWAAALAAGGLRGRRATAFTVLVTAAFLIRPILLPSLGLLWLGVVAGIRPRKRLLPGIGIGLAGGLASLMGLLHAQGDLASFLAAFGTHARRHTRNLLHNVGALPDYGFIKGSGGEWFAASLVLLAALGTVVWWRRVGGRAAATWLAVMTVGIGQLVHLQGRTFPRYSVPFQMALAPLAAGAAAALAPPAVAAAGLTAAGLVLARDAYPLLVEQHTLRMPGWDAVVTGIETARRRDLEVVVDPGLFPYYSYREEVLRWRGEELPRRRHLSPASPDHRSLPTDRYLVITDRPEAHLPGLEDREILYGNVSPELARLTQGRFLRAALIENPPLLLEGWWPRENLADREPFVWGRPGARLAIPPRPPLSRLVLDLRPARGDSDLIISGEYDLTAVIPGDSPRRAVVIPLPEGAAGRLIRLTFDREQVDTPGSRDTRPLAVQVFGVRSGQPDLAWHFALERTGIEAYFDVELEGFWDPESFAWGRGRWTHPAAAINLPPLRGELELLLAAPRTSEPELVILCQGKSFATAVTAGPETFLVSLPVPCDLRRAEEDLEIRLLARGFRPGGRDERDLGVVVGALAYRPAPPSEPRP